MVLGMLQPGTAWQRRGVLDRHRSSRPPPGRRRRRAPRDVTTHVTCSVWPLVRSPTLVSEYRCLLPRHYPNLRYYNKNNNDNRTDLPWSFQTSTCIFRLIFIFLIDPRQIISIISRRFLIKAARFWKSCILKTMQFCITMNIKTRSNTYVVFPHASRRHLSDGATRSLIFGVGYFSSTKSSPHWCITAGRTRPRLEFLLAIRINKPSRDEMRLSVQAYTIKTKALK